MRTYRVRDAVAEALWVHHVVLGKEQVVADELHGLSVDDGQVRALDHALHQVLVDQAAEGAPLITVEHDE